LPFDLQHVVLSNGSVILRRASLRPVQKVLRGPLGPLAARLSSKARFSQEFGRLFGANHPLPADEADDQWAMIANNGGHRIAHLLISYLDERERYAERWHGAVRDWPKPLSFLWALDDQVATTSVLDGLRELRPAADVVELPGVRHYPQVEVREVFIRAALSLLSTATH
jgi:pimeloyl-ACP methyl ester carboxylesterase